jgi:Arc/MetJ-type ribon-helix-helix transcriptional regulator
MRTEKLSISLTPEAIGVIDAYRAAHSVKSRSQVVEQALRRLREDELEAAYREASVVDLSEWDATLSDGLPHEAW